MERPQTQKTEELRALRPDNPFIHPKGHLCFINRLPPELLSYIFELASADYGAEDDDDIMMSADYWDDFFLLDAKEELGDKDEGDPEETDGDVDLYSTKYSRFLPPWYPFQIVISHVCRHWRNIALSTPSLWTTIDVDPVNRRSYDLELAQLVRSKDLPIRITLDFLHEYGDHTPDDNRRSLFPMVIPHIHRWRYMDVMVSHYYDMYAFLSAASDPSIPAAPQLTSLKLYYDPQTEEHDFGYRSMAKHLTLFGGTAPLLTTLVLCGVNVDWNQPWIASASNLRYLKLTFLPEDLCPSWAQFATILRGASSLEKLILRRSGPSEDPTEWFIEPTPGSPADLNAPIQLLRVTDFTLSFHSQARAIMLLRNFYLPALKNLVLEHGGGDYTHFVHELAGPATSLSPDQEQPHSLLSRLESLEIGILLCRGECAEMLYGELRDLRTLSISLSNLPRQFLDLLCPPRTLIGRGDILLPRLTTLYVSGVRLDVLREVVQRRWAAGVPLSSVFIKKSSVEEEGYELDEEELEDD